MENDEKIKELLTRGVEHIYPNSDYLTERLKSGEQLTVYNGIDPTGPALHIGHSVILLKLAQFQELGHRVILLIGDSTAMIGDPTDKATARKQLSRTEVLYNARLYKKQASTILKFGGKNPAKLRYNSKWLSKMSLENTFGVLSNMTYAQTIKRDMFQKRIAEGKDLYLHEFLYPMMQGYDSIAMDVDGEVGGNDQTFNMLVGRDLMKKLKNKEKFVVSMKLLVDPSGKKMGKTEGNMVCLNDKPDVMLGKIMSWPDTMILPAFELCTAVSTSDITEVEAHLESGANPKDAKLKLAETIVSMYYTEKKAKKAKENFLRTFSQGQIPADIKEVKVAIGTLLSDCLVSAGTIASKSEWRRLVGEKAISCLVSGKEMEKILDFNFKITEPAVFKIGKHRFLKITV